MNFPSGKSAREPTRSSSNTLVSMALETALEDILGYSSSFFSESFHNMVFNCVPRCYSIRSSAS